MCGIPYIHEQENIGLGICPSYWCLSLSQLDSCLIDGPLLVRDFYEETAISFGSTGRPSQRWVY